MSRAAVSKFDGILVGAGLQPGQTLHSRFHADRSKDRPLQDPIRPNVGAPTFSLAGGVGA
jgi:hypothetical protein